MSNIATSEQQFDAAYKAAQPKAVQDLMELPPGTASRLATAIQLADKGYVIDSPIMVWNYGPWLATQSRLAIGYTWVPSLLQPPVMMEPGLAKAVGGLQIYEPGIVPAGAILVTLDLDLLPHLFPTPAGA